MNYQSGFMALPGKAQEKILSLFEANGIQASANELDYYAWPETFGSTAGPNEGWGGCAMSTFTVHAFSYNDETAVLLCSKQFKFVEKFKPFMKF